MKALAAFLMRGRMQAVLTASTLAVLALLVTPLSIASSAVIGLVTLRQGPREGAFASLLGLLALAVLGQLLFGAPSVLVAMGVTLWLPIWGLGVVLRTSVSLARTLEVAAAAAAVLVGIQYLIGDPSAYWTEFLTELTAPLMESQVMIEADRQDAIAAMVPWMPGVLGATWLLQLTLSLFLARAMQAALYNPGGFREELQGLRLGYGMLILLPLLLALSWFSEGPSLAGQLSLVLAAAFLLQALGLVHALVAGRQMAVLILLGFYMLLVATFPTSLAAVAALGYVDGWFNFRALARVRADKGDGPSED